MSPKPLGWVGGVRCLGLFSKKKFLDPFPESEYEMFHLLNKKTKKMATELPFCSSNAQKLQQQTYAADIDEVN